MCVCACPHVLIQIYRYHECDFLTIKNSRLWFARRPDGTTRRRRSCVCFSFFFFFSPSALSACCFQLTAYRSASCYGARGVIHTIRLKENSTIVDSASFRCLWLLNVYPDGFLVKLTFFRSPSSSAQCQWVAVWLGRGCKRALLVWRKIYKKKNLCTFEFITVHTTHALPFIFPSRCKRGCKLKGWKAYTIRNSERCLLNTFTLTRLSESCLKDRVYYLLSSHCRTRERPSCQHIVRITSFCAVVLLWLCLEPCSCLPLLMTCTTAGGWATGLKGWCAVCFCSILLFCAC